MIRQRSATGGVGQNATLTKLLQLSRDRTFKACPGISTDSSLVDSTPARRSASWRSGRKFPRCRECSGPRV